MLFFNVKENAPPWYSSNYPTQYTVSSSSTSNVLIPVQQNLLGLGSFNVITSTGNYYINPDEEKFYNNQLNFFIFPEFLRHKKSKMSVPNLFCFNLNYQTKFSISKNNEVMFERQYLNKFFVSNKVMKLFKLC
jgi:hypothetical protein